MYRISKNRAISLINSSLTLSVITSVIVAVVFLLGIRLWAPNLLELRESFIYFVLFVVFTFATAANSIVDNVFVAGLRAGFTTTRMAIFNIAKLLLVVSLVGIFKSYGVWNSWGIALVISLVIGLFFFIPRIYHGFIPYPAFRFRETSGLIRYSVFIHHQ